MVNERIVSPPVFLLISNSNVRPTDESGELARRRGQGNRPCFHCCTYLLFLLI